MPAQVTNYKCPTCTGPLHFVGASGKLECDYCGAQLICDATTAATSCPYCGNPTVVPGQFCGYAEAGLRDPLQAQPRGRDPKAQAAL